MGQAILSVRMDEETKRAFADFCEQIGMSVSTAINVFARQTLRERRLPFTVSLDAPAVSAAPKVSTADAEGAGLSDGPAAGAPLRVLDHAAIMAAVTQAAEPFAGIDKVVLFGSYARGEAREDSDIDLRVIRSDTAPLSLMNIAAFSETVQFLTGKRVDVVSTRVIDSSELAEAIEREGVVVYEREG